MNERQTYNMQVIALIILIFSFNFSKGSTPHNNNANSLNQGWSDSVYLDSLRLEAESGTVEAPMVVLDDTKASGGKYVLAGGDINYNSELPVEGKISFEVPLESGDYRINCRVIFPSGSSDSFWVKVDDNSPVKWKGQAQPIDWTWLPVVVGETDIVTWSFAEPGIHTIQIYIRESGAKIDQIHITKYDDIPSNTKGTKDIYISQELGDDANNLGESPDSPIKTLHRAKEIATASQSEYDEFKIYLKGGETFTDWIPDTVSFYETDKTTFAFLWDIDKKLTISNYGSSEKAMLYGGKHKHEGGPLNAIGIIQPSTQDVLIENLSFKMWETGTIRLENTEDVHIRNIRIDSIGSLYFPDEQWPMGEDFPQCAGVVYPKNSTRVLIENVYMTNCHNINKDVTDLHGFYCTRLNHAEIRNCYLKNISGSALKFRRSPANNIHVHHNEFYYTGHTEQVGFAQPGWIRYSGDQDGGCPYAIIIEDNIFHYPYCISELEDCETATALKYSISNTTVCGADACEDPEKVLWRNNDFIYQWQADKITSANYLKLNERNYCLYDLYPNPFSDKTRLKIDFDKPSLVSISIIDATGRVVQDIMREEILEGNFSIPIEINHAAGYRTNGIYYCRIQIDNHVESQKILYIK